MISGSFVETGELEPSAAHQSVRKHWGQMSKVQIFV